MLACAVSFPPAKLPRRRARLHIQRSDGAKPSSSEKAKTEQGCAHWKQVYQSAIATIMPCNKPSQNSVT